MIVKRQKGRLSASKALLCVALATTAFVSRCDTDANRLEAPTRGAPVSLDLIDTGPAKPNSLNEVELTLHWGSTLPGGTTVEVGTPGGGLNDPSPYNLDVVTNYRLISGRYACALKRKPLGGAYGTWHAVPLEPDGVFLTPPFSRMLSSNNFDGVDALDRIEEQFELGYPVIIQANADVLVDGTQYRVVSQPIQLSR